MLSEEEHMAKKLGGATADDILYYARRMKIMKQKLLEVQKQVNLVHEMRVNGVDYENLINF